MVLDVKMNISIKDDTTSTNVATSKPQITNSVLTKAGIGINPASNNTPNADANTAKANKINNLLTKLCAELNINGITPEAIKKSGIIYRISGMNEVEFTNLPEKEINKIMDCLKAAIKDSTKDGKIDIQTAGDKGNKYYIALCTGWDSIEKYKCNSNGESLSLRLERFFGLDKKGIAFSELSEEKKNEYIQRYFNSFFVEKIKQAKSKTDKVKIYKQQLQDFGKLLNNTPDCEKAVFKQAIASLFATNRLPGMEAVLKSFDTPAARTEWAGNWSTEELKNVVTEKDVEGNVMKQEHATAFSAILTQNSSEEAIKERHQTHNEEAVKFFEENKEALERLAQKEANNEELTPEEEALKAMRDNYITGFKSGELIGTALNEVIGNDAKEALLDTMNKDAYELPNYKEVLEQVTKYIEEHPEVLKEADAAILDKATNGNYSKVAKKANDEFNAPRTSATSQKHSSYTAEDILSIKAKIEETRTLIYATSEEEKNQFTVISSVEHNYVTRERQNLATKLADKTPKEKLEYIVKNISKFSFGERLAVCDGFKQLGRKKLMDVLSRIHNDSFILKIYKTIGLTSDEVENLNVSITTKKLILNELKREGKEEYEQSV